MTSPAGIGLAERRDGRIIGVLIIGQMIGSGVVNFALEAPLSGSPGFLLNATLHSRQLGLAVVLGIVTEALWLGIAVITFTIVYPRTQRLALWFVAVAGITLAVAVVENIGVMSMLSLSEAYTKASDVDRTQLQAAGVVVESVRDWAHLIARIVHGGAIFVFYALLYQCNMIPRILAGFGLIAAVLMVASLGLPLFGQGVVFPLLVPMALCQLVVAIWLIAKGVRSSATR